MMNHTTTTSTKWKRWLRAGFLVAGFAIFTIGCEQSKTVDMPPDNGAPVSIQSDEDSGKTSIYINVPGLKLEIDTAPDGADVSVETPKVDVIATEDGAKVDLKSPDEKQ